MATGWDEGPRGELAEPLIETHRALADHGLEAQRLNARLGQDFYEGLIDGSASTRRTTAPEHRRIPLGRP